jgi:hypothetical protein
MCCSVSCNSGMQLVVSCVRDEVEAMAYTHTHTQGEVVYRSKWLQRYMN